MDFWSVHSALGGAFFLFLLTILPRTAILFMVSLTAIASGVVAGFDLNKYGAESAFASLVCLMWILWLVLPRVLIGCIALWLYSDTDLKLSLIAANLGFISVMLFVHMIRNLPMWQMALRRALDWLVERWRGPKVSFEIPKVSLKPRANDQLYDGDGKPYSLDEVKAAYADQMRKHA